jgi:hypothetical protein
MEIKLHNEHNKIYQSEKHGVRDLRETTNKQLRVSSLFLFQPCSIFSGSLEFLSHLMLKISNKVQGMG